MHTFTSLNWLASHPPESSHPVRVSEERRLKHKLSSHFNLRYQRDLVPDIGDHNTRVCLCSSFDQSDGKGNSSQLCYLILGAETAGAGSTEQPRRGIRDPALATAGSQGSFNLAAK